MKFPFPCFELVVNSAKKGGAYPAVANAANDKLVSLFLQDKISYNDIYKGINGALERFNGEYHNDFESLDNANRFAVNYVKQEFGG